MWILPTMSRPVACQAVIDSMVAANLSTPGLVIVNGDPGNAYRSIRLPAKWSIITFEDNRGVCGAMNWAFEQFPRADFYALVCDDEFVFTEQFDLKLIEAAGRWNIAHGNDGWQSETRIHTYATWGGELIRAVGWWSLPGLWHWYFDDCWELIASEFGLRRFCRDVLTEHRHYTAGRATFDPTYQAGQSRAGQDQAVFEDWKRDEWPALRGRLRQIRCSKRNAANHKCVDNASNGGIIADATPEASIDEIRLCV